MNNLKLKVMKRTISIVVLTTIFLLFDNAVFAQNIIISLALEQNSEPLKVKIGTAGFGKIPKWKFGEFAVVQSKAGWTKTTSKSNLFNTKTESKTTQKFSFTMCNLAGDTALVNAAKNIEWKSVQGFEIFPGFFIGDKDVKLDAFNFTATITINRDTSATWLLLMQSEAGSESANTGNAMLTNGTRKMLIYSATSNLNGTDNRTFPAAGYEFREGDDAWMALQYFGGGALGYNKNIVWISSKQTEQMKLMLAAAATAAMQLKFSEMGDEE